MKIQPAYQRALRCGYLATWTNQSVAHYNGNGLLNQLNRCVYLATNADGD